MKGKSRPARYILLPATRTDASENANPEIRKFLVRLNENVRSGGKVKLKVRDEEAAAKAPIDLTVIDSINDDGPKLVELDRDQMAYFRFSYPGLRIIPERFYRNPPLPFQEFTIRTQRTLQSISSEITVTAEDSRPVGEVYVVAFTDFRNREGAGGTTDKEGRVRLDLITNKVERLYVYPQHSYWGYFRADFVIDPQLTVSLVSIDPNFRDSLRFFYDTSSLSVIQGTVKVAVIDTGVGPHDDLVVAGGSNTVEGEDELDYSDNGVGHGTHVAGIIAANGGIKGVAAGVEIYSYRVFPRTGEASSFFIMKAIKKAIDDGCDLINMSLGSQGLDEGLVSYVKDAYDNGVLCFAANGNDDRGPVNFPAAYSLCVAVSAMGRKGTYPPQSVQESIAEAPFGSDPDNFIADFSNIGPETDLTAPGVGIISTFPGNFYAIMDGTSMACPAAVGMAARLLSSQPEILSLPRTQQRTDAMLKFLSLHTRSLGFSPTFEGKGMLF